MCIRRCGYGADPASSATRNGYAREKMARSKDIFSKEKRSRVMASIGSRNTKFEMAFFKVLSAEVYPKGYRYRKHYAGATGKPDLAFVKQKVAVFLDSDFWHGRNFQRLAGRLKNAFWREKIRGNILRDRKVSRMLRQEGWTVVRLREETLSKDPLGAASRVVRLLEART